MGRKILLAVVWWLALSESDAVAKSVQLEDSVAEASLPRLYRSVPTGVYASASPYASFSFHIPAFAASPKIAHVGPIKQESTIVENTQGFLKDSYGNKFVQSPQSLPYRTAFPQQYVQLQELPAHLVQPLVAAAPSFQYKQVTPHFFAPGQFKVDMVQAASPSAANHYAINQPYSFGSIRTLAPAQKQQRDSNVNDRGQLKAVASTNRGKNAAIKLETKPAVPLLDLSLLEPLTFENPLVPQVQHFLPRISSVTYHKLPELNVNGVKSKTKEIMIQKIKSYDSDDNKAKVNVPRQKQQVPHHEDEDTEDEDSPRGPPNRELDSSYERKSPNYKESYNEKVLNYNKETDSEPVHYSYAMKSEKEPLTYNYVRTTNEPYKEEIKNENYDNNDQNAKHLIYKFKPEENDEDDSHNDHGSQRREPVDSSEERNEDEAALRHTKQNKDKGYKKETYHNERAEHREDEHQRKPEKIVNKKEDHHRKPDKTIHRNVQHSNPREQVETISVDNPDAHYQPILKEYEEDIRIAPTPKEYDSIKVDPNQHIQPQRHDSREPENPDDRPHYHPEQHVEEKAKRIIITEETPNPDAKEENDEGSNEQDGKSDEDFDKGYKKSAYGFPAYHSRDTEKEIYNSEPYAPARYQNDFEAEHSPFERYVADSDDYPKSTRSNYKDSKDKTKERYYLDYAVSKPESMLARYKQKEDYYKMYMNRKPEFANKEHETDTNNEKHSAKYAAAPAYEYHAAAQKPKQYFAKYKAAPQAYGYDYAKEAPKDNSAHATGPYQRLKTYTQFVEPQFQYGFEPSALPRLLDSELAVMASNHRPENEPLMRKKVYKENWYIKKTSTNGRKADS